MPEGDTVWLACKRLHDALHGQVLTTTDLRVPQLATADLTGREVLEVVARGKHLMARLSGGVTLHTHLRMDGSWHLYRHGEPWKGGPVWQVRVLLETATWQAVGYRLPVVELLATGAEQETVGHLGPDILGPDWDAAEAVRRLRADPDREIGPALLDQRNLAGIGNLYKAEALFVAGLNPWRRVSEVDVAMLVDRAARLLQRNKGEWSQITTGNPRRGLTHWVFERSGQPCQRCGTRILLAEQGEAPYPRFTYWCPTCQPGASPTPMRRADVARTVGRARYRP